MIKTLKDFSKTADYSLLNKLCPDSQAKQDGQDREPREIKSGHYVPVSPEPIQAPRYLIHSKTFFKELSICDELALEEDFIRMFSGDLSHCPEPMKNQGWACGYALSIYGTEYTEQCPFRTGNAYGDGRAISIFEGILNGKRWEMQLKGGGRTPYCRGADGRAVLRSSVREFLAQEHMHGLGIPSSRSFTLYVSDSESVHRPWFHQGSHSTEPEVMINEFVAISTRVAPSFLRVGQIELFGRRARNKEHQNALKELKDIVFHSIEREYPEIFSSSISSEHKILELAKSFRTRLVSLVSNWIRVGYCQGNFNSDNCALGGYTLDFGPFGYIDMFSPDYQPWTGGGLHFSFFNQPQAAQKNSQMLCRSLAPLLEHDPTSLSELSQILNDFPYVMEDSMNKMWASKLGLPTFHPTIFNKLIELMSQSYIDYTIFFRELSHIPETLDPLYKSFYSKDNTSTDLLDQWVQWHQEWLSLVKANSSTTEVSELMKKVNPKYILREWLLVPAYQKAYQGDYRLIEELNEIMSDPYAEQTPDIEEKYYRKKALELFNVAGVSHVSCSS